MDTLNNSSNAYLSGPSGEGQREHPLTTRTGSPR